jgi:hypothetical protein
MTQQQWVVTVEYDGTITEDQGVDLVNRAGADFPIVTIDQGADRTRVSFAVQASTLRRATDTGLKAARDLVADLIAGEPVALHVVTEEQLAQEALTPNIPPLIDSAGARQLLGVSTQPQMYALERRPDFPPPVTELSGGRRIYVEAAVKAFASRWDRRPGRPRKTGTGE